MLASIFLAPVLQSLIATAIFESGKEGVSFLAGKKSMEGRYRNAFERAISRFYADPEYAGNAWHPLDCHPAAGFAQWRTGLASGEADDRGGVG